MSMTTGIDGLDRSIHETNIWLNELQERLGTKDRKQAYRALKATLHAVRDRVGPTNAAHLAAQLPLLIKGIFYDSWRPSEGPTKERTKHAFLEHVDSVMFRGLQMDTEHAVREVLHVLAEHVEPAEIAKLERLFPEDLRELWPGLAITSSGM
jgi:uncharacterized protein (DUF2267 family)